MHASESYGGGEQNQELGDKAGEEDDQSLDEELFLFSRGSFIKPAVRVVHVPHHPKALDQSQGDEDGRFFSNGPDRGGENDGLHAVEAGKIPALGRGADDGVGPIHLHAAKEHGGEDGGEAPGGEEGREGENDEPVREAIHDGDGETAEARPSTLLAAKMSHRPSNVCGDGLGFHHEDFRLHPSPLFCHFLVQKRCVDVIRLGRINLEGRRSRSLDHGQRGNHVAVDISDLTIEQRQPALHIPPPSH